MGGSVSKTVVDSMVSNSIKVINNFEQQCTASPSEQQLVFNLYHCNVGTGGSFNVNNQQYLTQSCITNSTVQTSISSSVNQAMRQQAQAVVQQFAFGTFSLAEDFINASITLADEISNTYNSTCAAEASKQKIELNCIDSTINGVIEVGNYQSITQACIINAVTNSTVYQNAISKFSQSAVAQQQATFAYILFGFAAILAVFAWFLVSVASTPVVQWLIVGVVLFSVVGSIIYAGTAKSAGNYPYTKP